MNKRIAPYFFASLAALITFIVYLRTLQNNFVNWDDDVYVLNNIHIRVLNFEFLRWAFSDFYAANWHPLTWLSHAVDYALWGLNPAGHHLMNIVLHSANTFLVVFLVIRLLKAHAERKTGQGGEAFFTGDVSKYITAGVTGVLFGLHPVHVESVAWVAERKDLLCGLFYLLSVMAYISFRTSRNRRTYFVALVFFILALLSKPMAVTLPFVLLILDWHPFGRIRSKGELRDAVVEKMPFIVLSLGSAVVTVFAQKTGGAIVPLEFFPFSTRVLVGFQSLVLYLWKMVWPLELVPYYAYPKAASVFSWEYLFPIVLVVTATAGCLAAAKKRPVLAAVWGYYVVTLLPVLGIVQVGNQAMADRYTYLPGLGPFLLIGLGAAWTWEKAGSLKQHGRALRRSGIAAAILLTLCLSYLTLNQITVWKNNLDLWNYVIDRESDPVAIAYNNRGLAFQEAGQTESALSDFTTAITLDPYNFVSYMAYVNRGILFKDLGQVYKALEDYNMAIILNPGYANAYYNRGWMYAETGQLDRAIEDYSKAIDINPDYSEAYNNRGVAFEDLNQLERAILDYKKAITLNPSDFLAYSNMGMALSKLGREKEAIDNYSKAIALNPDLIKAYVDRGKLYLKTGDQQRAESDFQRADALDGGSGRDRMTGERR